MSVVLDCVCVVLCVGGLLVLGVWLLFVFGLLLLLLLALLMLVVVFLHFFSFSGAL